MKKTIIIIIILFYYFGYSQAPYIEWEKSYGGIYADGSYCIRQTSDGGYISVGLTSAQIDNGDVFGVHGSSDIWVVKLNNLGSIEWQKAIGGSDSEQVSNIEQTTDGEYIIFGSSRSINGDLTNNFGSMDCWVIKINSIGTIIWQKKFGGTGNESIERGIQTNDGGYIFCGNTNSSNNNVTTSFGGMDGWIVKLSALGVIEWQKSFGGLSTDSFADVKQTLDGNYIIVGTTNSNNNGIVTHGLDDFWVLKINSTGTIIWQKILGGTNWDYVNCLQLTTDRGFIIGGSTASTNGDITNYHGGYFDYWVVKLNDLGNIVWQKTLGGSDQDQLLSINVTQDGGYILAGETSSSNGDITNNHGNKDYWLTKINESGSLQWQTTLGGSNDDEAYSFLQTSDGGYIVSGQSLSIDGDISNSHGSMDNWVVKLSSNLSVETYSSNINNCTFIYPNPAFTHLTVESKEPITQSIISDCNGRVIKTDNQNSNTATLNIENLETGIYFLRIVSKNGSKTEKIVKE